MQLIEIKDNKVITPIGLSDGSYYIRAIPLKNKSKKAFSEEYFAIIDEYAKHTGNSRYEIHELFKQHSQLESTKNLSIEEWPQIIEQLKYWTLIIND